MEEWRPVPGYEEFYEVSDQGRIRRIKGGSGARAGLVLTNVPTADGYYQVGLCREGCVRYRKVHMIVMTAFVGPYPEGMEINHKNGIKTDNRLENLEYCTRRENLKHAARLGLLRPNPNYAERHHNAKLTWERVREIRRLYREGTSTTRQLAVTFGICRETVRRVLRNEIWRE